MSSSESGSTSEPTGEREIPRWILEPRPAEGFLIVKAGMGVTFPDYLREALRRYEAEVQREPLEPGLEATCGNRCGNQRITVF